MKSESRKFPVESAPQQTYTYTFRGLFRLSWVIAGVIEGLCICIADYFWGLGGWKMILILFLIITLLILAMVVINRKIHGFITISPEELTFAGALNFKDGFKRNFSQDDFDKVSHFGWEQIQHIGFTREVMRLSYLFVELTDGETYYFPLSYFEDEFVIVDTLRKFTGYSGCKDLGRYRPYVRRLRSGNTGMQN